MPKSEPITEMPGQRKRRAPRVTSSVLAISMLLLTLAAPFEAKAQNVIVYPAQGQTLEQQAGDEGECRSWAQNQTGYGVGAPQGHTGASIGPQGEVVGKAARGAALGAVGGLIAGKAGKGAAIGAGVGATAGLFGRRKRMRQEEAAAQEAQAAQQAAYQDYMRAFAVCMEGRGYSVN